MSITKLILVVPTLLIAAVYAVVSSTDSSTETAPVKPVRVDAIDYTTTTTTTTTVAPATTTTVITLPEGFSIPTLKPNVPCQEWTQVALDAGWPPHLLSELFWEVWSESRCQNIIEGHPNWNGHDRGPLQINQVWLDDIEAKYGTWEVVNDPRYNFAWAWEMFKWYEHHRGCGFIPWSRPCKD
jgi:hypothetical protein